jgi:hypothetical protein
VDWRSPVETQGEGFKFGFPARRENIGPQHPPDHA